MYTYIYSSLFFRVPGELGAATTIATRFFCASMESVVLELCAQRQVLSVGVGRWLKFLKGNFHEKKQDKWDDCIFTYT